MPKLKTQSTRSCSFEQWGCVHVDMKPPLTLQLSIITDSRYSLQTDNDSCQTDNNHCTYKKTLILWLKVKKLLFDVQSVTLIV